jgi:hypothetical protein
MKGKMKKLFYCILVLYFLFVCGEGAFGYLGKSIRLMGIGDELAGVIKDEYTDIYRNPAYLSFVEKPRIFGQYNQYRHIELKIAEYFTNQETGLMGVVLPFTKYGNLALIGELRPSTAEDNSARISRTEYLDYYTLDSSSVEKFSKKTIQNFKAIYGLKLSASLRLGIDFVYLKNYNQNDSKTKRITTQRYFDSENLKSYGIDDRVSNNDNSPDAQRGSIGMVLTASQKTSLDLTLYYENLSYTSKSLSTSESQTKWFGVDTTLREGLSSYTLMAPTKEQAVGLDANYKYLLPQNTTLAILLGGRYQKNEVSSLSQNRDSSYSTPDFVTLGNSKNSLQYNNKVYSFVMGIGLEKDFSHSIKVGVAIKGYWDREKLDREEWKESSYIYMVDDSVTSSSSYFEEKIVRKTINSYKLNFPIGSELVLHKMIKARFGGILAIERKGTETGHSTTSKSYYSQGFGLSYNERIFLDAYFKDELTPIKNWMVKVEYRF